MTDSITEMAEKTLQQSLDILLARFAIEVSNNMDSLYEIQQKYLDIIIEVIKEKLWVSIMMR